MQPFMKAGVVLADTLIMMIFVSEILLFFILKRLFVDGFSLRSFARAILSSLDFQIISRWVFLFLILCITPEVN